MKKKETIKSKQEFSDLINNAKFKKNKEFVIYYKENNFNKNRFGIAISNKIGNAVIRNKLKRQTREIITNSNILFKNTKDYIIMIRKESLITPFKIKEENFKNLIKEINS